jgi:hypothetical protein
MLVPGAKEEVVWAFYFTFVIEVQETLHCRFLASRQRIHRLERLDVRS